MNWVGYRSVFLKNMGLKISIFQGIFAPKWVWEPKKRSVTLWNHAYHTLIHVPGFWNDWRGLIWPSGHHKSTFLVSTSCLVYVWNALMRHKGHHNSWWEAPFKELKIVPRPAKYSCHFKMSYWHHRIDFTHQIRWEWPNFMCMGALARGSKMSLGAQKRSVALWNHAQHTLIHVPGFWNDLRGSIWPSGHHESAFSALTRWCPRGLIFWISEVVVAH